MDLNTGEQGFCGFEWEVSESNSGRQDFCGFEFVTFKPNSRRSDPRVEYRKAGLLYSRMSDFWGRMRCPRVGHRREWLR